MAETFAPPRIEAEPRPDGRLLIRSVEPLAEHPVSVVHSFRAGSAAHPDRLLVAERRGEDWARLTWGEAREQVDALAQGLLDRGLADRPVMVLSGNSRLHLVVSLAAMTVGAPVVPTSVAYSLQSADHAKLRAMADLVDPGLVVAEDASFAAAVAAVWRRRRAARWTVGARTSGGTTSPRSSSRPARPAPRRACSTPTACCRPTSR
jgi:feruloyl-CoA synthase